MAAPLHVIEAAPGHGSTSTVLHIVRSLYQRHPAGAVAGFCLRPVFSPRGSGGFVRSGYDGLLLGSGEVRPIASIERTDWKQVSTLPFREDLPPDSPTTYFVSEANVTWLLDRAEQHAQRPQTAALVIDGLDPLLARLPRRKGAQATLIGTFLRRILAAPKAVNVVVVKRSPVRPILDARQEMEEQARANGQAVRKWTLDPVNWRRTAYELAEQLTAGQTPSGS